MYILGEFHILNYVMGANHMKRVRKLIILIKKYIHEQGLIHRDIKLENLFLDDNFNIKIGYFNVSATIDEKSAANFTDQEDDLEQMTNL